MDNLEDVLRGAVDNYPEAEQTIARFLHTLEGLTLQQKRGFDWVGIHFNPAHKYLILLGSSCWRELCDDVGYTGEKNLEYHNMTFGTNNVLAENQAVVLDETAHSERSLIRRPPL